MSGGPADTAVTDAAKLDRSRCNQGVWPTLAHIGDSGSRFRVYGVRVWGLGSNLGLSAFGIQSSASGLGEVLQLCFGQRKVMAC